MTRLLLTLLLTFVSSSGCGEPSPIVDPPFAPFLESFRKDAAARGIHNLRRPAIRMAELPDREAKLYYGFCRRRKDNITVVINVRYWGSLTEGRQKRLIYHELGHCLLGRRHMEDDSESFMYPFILGAIPSVREEHELDKLFDPAYFGDLWKE